MLLVGQQRGEASVGTFFVHPRNAERKFIGKAQVFAKQNQSVGETAQFTGGWTVHLLRTVKPFNASSMACFSTTMFESL